MNLRSRRVVGQPVIRCQLTDGPLSPDQSDCGQLSQLETGFRAIWRSDQSERNDDAPIRHHPATTHRLGCRDKVTTLIKSINDQSRPIKTLEEEAVVICWQRPKSRSKWMNPLFVKTLFSSPVQSILFLLFCPKNKKGFEQDMITLYFLLNTIWYVCFLADFAVVPRCWDRPGISPASRLPPTIPGILFHQQPIFGQTFIFLENIIQPTENVPSILPFSSERYLQQMTRYWFVQMNRSSLAFREDSHKNTHTHLRIDVWLVIEWILRIEWKEERNNERDRKDHRGWKDLRDHH